MLFPLIMLDISKLVNDKIISLMDIRRGGRRVQFQLYQIEQSRHYQRIHFEESPPFHSLNLHLGIHRTVGWILVKVGYMDSIVLGEPQLTQMNHTKFTQVDEMITFLFVTIVDYLQARYHYKQAITFQKRENKDMYYFLFRFGVIRLSLIVTLCKH